MKQTQKVTNIASQLPTYCDQGTNNLEQVTNTSRNAIFAFFFKSMSLKELLKFSHRQKKSIWLKMNPTQKVTNISCQLPTCCDKGTNKSGQVTNISRNTRFVFFFKSMFLKEVLKLLNSQKKKR